jgi:hypothetical protein
MTESTPEEIEWARDMWDAPAVIPEVREMAVQILQSADPNWEYPVIVRHVTVAGNTCIEYEIAQLNDGIFRLTWGDGVANTWEEVYSNLAVAYVRLGTLLYATASDKLFAQEQAPFAQAALDFMDGESR